MSKAARTTELSTLRDPEEQPRELDNILVEDESTITVASTTIVASGIKKPVKSKAKPAVKTRQTRGKRKDVADDMDTGVEAEDDDFEVKIPSTTKTRAGRKRKTEDNEDTMVESEPPPTKRRNTRSRVSLQTGGALSEEASSDVSTMQRASRSDATSKPLPSRKQTRRSSRSASNTHKAPITLPDDAELDQALEADLERRMTMDEEDIIPVKVPKHNGNTVNPNHAMFGLAPIAADDAAIEAELLGMEKESRPMPKGKSIGKPTRKASAKLQPRKKPSAQSASEDTAATARPLTQICVELEDSMMTLEHSSPMLRPKKRSSNQGKQPQRQNKSQSKSIVDEASDHSTSDGSIHGQAIELDGASEATVVVKHAAAAQTMDQNRSMTEDIFYSPNAEAHTSLHNETSSTENARPGEVSIAPATSAIATVSYSRESLAQNILTPQPSRSVTPPGAAEIPGRTPSFSPQTSDAENQPPSSKPSATREPKPQTPHARTTRVPLGDALQTPIVSPSKRNIIAGLQTSAPWSAADLESVFLKSPGSNENTLLAALKQSKAGKAVLAEDEQNMTVEQWIHHNAALAEEKLRNDCEFMVGCFERQGARAMAALEGIYCSDE